MFAAGGVVFEEVRSGAAVAPGDWQGREGFTAGFFGGGTDAAAGGGGSGGGGNAGGFAAVWGKLEARKHVVMTTAVKLVTVAEFLDRPDVAGGYEELRQGEVFMVAFPRYRHGEVQFRIQMALIEVIGEVARVRVEMAFRARPEFEFRRADIGVISVARAEVADEEGYISGAPEIVIEVESPSNTAREFREKEALCLANGALAFWVVYPDRREVTVAVAEGRRTYHDGDEIELRGFGEKRVAVSELLGPRRK